MLRLAFDFIITWRETRTRPNAYILFIALIVLLFFGGKKIPELMKGLGKGVKSFKEGMNGVEDDIDGKDKKGETKE